jgi:hypothetical protein
MVCSASSAPIKARITVFHRARTSTVANDSIDTHTLSPSTVQGNGSVESEEHKASRLLETI